MASYQTEIDIANRALQHCRMRRIQSFIDASPNAAETGFSYPKLREAELRSNLWRFATRRTVLRAVGNNSYIWTPPTYNAATTYNVGSIVVDAGGIWWQSKKASNIGNTPGIGVFWGRYFGVDYCSPFIASASQFAAPAAPVITPVISGALIATTYFVIITYLSASGETLASPESSLTVAANSVPSIASPPAVTGATGWNCYIGTASGQEELQATNTAIGAPFQVPNTGLIDGIGSPLTNIPAFYAGELTNFNGTLYLSLTNNNSEIPTGNNWMAVNGTVVQLQILYPIGAGPATQISTLNTYRLPHGFIRQAPSNPKGSANTWLGAPWGNIREDWVFEGDYLVSRDFGPIMLRFVADFVDVPDMDPMFCEMLASRIATEVAPILCAQDVLPTILRETAEHYREERRKAVTVNGIEVGPIDRDIDDYITCRA